MKNPRGSQKRTDFNTSNAELNKGTEHFPASDFVCCATDCAFDEQTVVMRLPHSNEISFRPKCLHASELTVICAPAKPELASRRTPFPPALRYTSILPVSGWKPSDASSVVIRHCMANPRREIASCVRPSWGRVAPAAICI